MKHKIRFFKQHSLETCGISCLLMVLYAFGRVQYPTVKQERKLYSIYRCRSFVGTLGVDIANCLARNKLKVSLLHSSVCFLDNRGNYYPKELYETMQREYLAVANRISDYVDIETNASITVELFRTMLDEGKLLIVQCVVPGDADGIHTEVLHWILLYGYDGADFLACDPLSSKIRLNEDKLKKYIDTPVGQICISVGENES